MTIFWRSSESEVSLLEFVKEPFVFGAKARTGQQHHSSGLTNLLYGVAELECQRNRRTGKTKVTKNSESGAVNPFR